MTEIEKKLKAEEERIEKLMFGDPKGSEGEAGDAQNNLADLEAEGQVGRPNDSSATVDTPKAPMKQEETDASAELVKLQNRFNKYKASGDIKISNLRREVSTLSTKLANVLEENASLRSSMQTPEASPADLFTEEDEQVFGKEATERLKQREAERYERFVKPLQEAEEARKQAEIEKHKRKAQRSNKDREESFKAKLTELRPDWQTEIKSPEFTEFIKSTDEFGVPYIDTFKMAEQRLNFGIISNIYKTFDALQANKSRNPELDKHIAPKQGTSNQAPVQAGPNEIVITQAFVDQFYSDARKGLHNKTIEDMEKAAEIEKHIDQWYLKNIGV